MKSSLATGLYKNNEDEKKLVFAFDVAQQGDSEVVLYTEALHPVQKYVLNRSAFEDKYTKLHKPVFTE